METTDKLTLKIAVSNSIFVLSYLSIIPVVKYSMLSRAKMEQECFPIDSRNVTASEVSLYIE